MDAYDNVPPASFKSVTPAQRPARGVTPQAQLAFNAALLDAAHGLGLSAGLKNALDLLGRSFADGRRVSDAYDWWVLRVRQREGSAGPTGGGRGEGWKWEGRSGCGKPVRGGGWTGSAASAATPYHGEVV